jgi:hypothetical protein
MHGAPRLNSSANNRKKKEKVKANLIMRSSKKPEWVAAIAAVIATCVAKG